VWFSLTNCVVQDDKSCGSACQDMALIPLKMALIPKLENHGLPSIEA